MAILFPIFDWFKGVLLYICFSFYKAYRRFLLSVVLIVCSLNLQAGTKPDVPEKIEGASNLTAEQVVELVLSNPELVIIDSRKKTEYVKGHIEGSINILNTQLTEYEMQKVLPDKSSHVLFYCNGSRCMRSSDATSKALSWGYSNVYWFRGGWKEWTSKKLPVITE